MGRGYRGDGEGGGERKAEPGRGVLPAERCAAAAAEHAPAPPPCAARHMDVNVQALLALAATVCRALQPDRRRQTRWARR